MDSPSPRQASASSSVRLPNRTSYRDVRRTVLVVIVVSVVVLSVLYGVAVLTSPSTSSPASTTSPSSAPTTVDANVVLQAPFNGTTVSVVATVSTNPSVPHVETLAAQYRPTGNGSTALFSSYYGTFVATVVNWTNQPHGVNVTLTVTYGGIMGRGNASVVPGEGEVLIPVVMGPRGLQAVSPVTLSTTNGATECPTLGGSWDKTSATCTFSVYASLGSLTIDAGVTLVGTLALEVGKVINHGTIITVGIIDGSPGTVIENDATIYTVSGGDFVNLGTINNNGTINNGGTISNCYGATINNPYGGTILNYGTVDNDGTLYNNGTIDNLYGIIYNLNGGGTIINYGTIENDSTINNWYVIKNYGNIYNWGTIYNNCVIWIFNYHEIAGNLPIGGTVIYG